jgi:hypothetical protein
MRFWWVNHKQTMRQEIAGGYLWLRIPMIARSHSDMMARSVPR